MEQPNTKRRRLRTLLADGGTVVAPGVYDCLTARLVQRARFDAAIVTGAGVAASVLGVPDFGLITMSEAVGQTHNICQSVDIPIVADCDTGYGNPINVARTIREFEAAGAAALFMEDQHAPKKCGHFEGKQVLPAADMVQKIRAAVDARVDPDLILIARTDARAVEGIEAAVTRAATYARAGADMLFVEAPFTREELVYVGENLAPLGTPLMVNLVEGGRTPLVPVSELSAMGFNLISFSGSMQKTAIKAMQGLLSSLRENGTVDSHYPSDMVSLEERSEILGLPEFYKLEQQYLSE